MKTATKIIIPVIFLIIGIFLGQDWFNLSKIIANQNIERDSINLVADHEKITVSLMLDFGNGEVRTYNDIILPTKTTVFELLKKVTTENNLEFSSKDYGSDLGAFIESINQVKNDPKKDYFWHYWVNNQYAEVGASNYHLKNGDIVEWKYIRNQFNLINN